MFAHDRLDDGFTRAVLSEHIQVVCSNYVHREPVEVLIDQPRFATRHRVFQLHLQPQLDIFVCCCLFPRSIGSQQRHRCFQTLLSFFAALTKEHGWLMYLSKASLNLVLSKLVFQSLFRLLVCLAFQPRWLPQVLQMPPRCSRHRPPFLLLFFGVQFVRYFKVPGIRVVLLHRAVAVQRVLHLLPSSSLPPCCASKQNWIADSLHVWHAVDSSMSERTPCAGHRRGDYLPWHLHSSSFPRGLPPPATHSRRLIDAREGHASRATAAVATAGDVWPLTPFGAGHSGLTAAAAAAVGGAHTGRFAPRDVPPPAASSRRLSDARKGHADSVTACAATADDASLAVADERPLLPFRADCLRLTAATAAAVGGACVGSIVPRDTPPPAAPSRRLSDARGRHASSGTAANATAGDVQPLLPSIAGHSVLTAVATAAVGGARVGSSAPRDVPPPAASSRRLSDARRGHAISAAVAAATRSCSALG